MKVQVLLMGLILIGLGAGLVGCNKTVKKNPHPAKVNKPWEHRADKNNDGWVGPKEYRKANRKGYAP